MNDKILLGRDTDATQQEQHETAVELLPIEKFSLYEAAHRVDLLTIQMQPRDAADRSGMGAQAQRYFLVFSTPGAEEVLVAAYESDSVGRVNSWRERYEMWGYNLNCTCDKLRFAILNEVVQAWTL